MSLKDQKLYWKLLDKLQTRNKDTCKIHISGKRWNEHFKRVLINDARALNPPPPPPPPQTPRKMVNWTTP